MIISASIHRVLRAGLTALAALTLTGSLAGCGINSVPTKEEAVNAQWANVQSAYQRRADLIPNLVATVRGAAGSESQILTEVTNARARATSINITSDDLSDPAEFQRFQEAQNQLTQAMGQLRTVVEAYPQLQSQPRFADLMTAIEGSENQINVERIRYNEAVQDFNTEIRTFPSVIGARIVHGAEPRIPFQAAPGSDVAPTVDFGSMGGTAPAAAPANDNLGARAPAAATN